MIGFLASVFWYMYTYESVQLEIPRQIQVMLEFWLPSSIHIQACGPIPRFKYVIGADSNCYTMHNAGNGEAWLGA